MPRMAARVIPQSFRNPFGRGARMSLKPTPRDLRMIGVGMGILLLPGIVLAVVTPGFADIFEAFGAELPWLTGVFVHHRLAFFLLPLIVPLVWWLLARRPRASASRTTRPEPALAALLLAIGLALAMIPLTIFAMYLPIFRLGQVVG